MQIANVILRSVVFFSIVYLLSECNRNDSQPGSLNTAEQMHDSIVLMTQSLSRNLSAKGPMAWLDYFERASPFYMVSDGELVFPDLKTADDFVRGFSKQIRKIDLNFSSIRVDSVSNNSANLGAGYNETLTDTAGKTRANHGYVTALVDQTKNGWQFRNLHWSEKH